jgi:hypothetical protein
MQISLYCVCMLVKGLPSSQTENCNLLCMCNKIAQMGISMREKRVSWAEKNKNSEVLTESEEINTHCNQIKT